MRSFVIGGAGFIGSHLVDRLVARGPVTAYDNLSAGKRAFLEPHLATSAAALVEADVLDLDRLTSAMAGHDVIFHLAANPEARWGLTNTRLDLEQGTIATYNVLEAMRRTPAHTLVFSSSGTVYGETPRACAEPDLGSLPISLYGASKLAGEAMVSAFVECFGLTARIFRFGNVVGPRGTHGAALDFLNKLARPHPPRRPRRRPPVQALPPRPRLRGRPPLRPRSHPRLRAPRRLQPRPPGRDRRRPHRRALRPRLPLPRTPRSCIPAATAAGPATSPVPAWTPASSPPSASASA